MTVKNSQEDLVVKEKEMKAKLNKYKVELDAALK
jgi:hypothetical protein